MRKKIFTFLFYISVISLFAQNNNDSSILNIGVYEDFDQFKTNNPVDYDSLSLEKNSFISRSLLGRGNHKLITYKNGTKEKAEKHVWGFFDGKYIYKKFDHSFNILLNLGYYCLFDTEVKTKKPGVQYVSSIYFPKHFKTYKLAYVLEYKTGKIYRLNSINMEHSILLHEPDLLKKYKAETNKEDKVLEYIKILNEKYPVNHFNEK